MAEEEKTSKGTEEEKTSEETQTESKSKKGKDKPPEPFMVEGKTVTPEQAAQWKKDAQNVKNMQDQMTKQGELANASKQNAEAFEQLRTKYGDAVVQNMLAPVVKQEKEPLLKTPDFDEGVDPAIAQYEKEKNDTISQFAETTNKQIADLTQVVQTLVAKQGRDSAVTDRERFAAAKGIDLLTAEGQQYMQNLEDFGKQNSCFPIEGPPGGQYVLPDKAGYDATWLLFHQNQGRQAVQDGNMDQAQASVNALIGGPNGLNVKFEPTPSRQGASAGLDVAPIVEKMQGGKPLTRREVDSLKTQGYHLPADYPTAD